MWLEGCTGQKEKPELLTPERGEISRERLEKVIQRSVADMNRLFDINLDASEVFAKTTIVNTIREFQAILREDTTKEYDMTDMTGKLEAVTTDESSPRGKSILLNLQSISDSLSKIANEPNFELLQDEYLEMLIKHEIVHFSSRRYTSEQLHSVVYGKIFASTREIRDKNLTTAYVQGAGVVTFVQGDPIGKNPFYLLEEAEAFFISDVAMRARGRALVLVPLAPEDHELSAQVQLLTRALSRIDRNPVNSARLLMNLRMREGGREELSNILAKAFPEAAVKPGDELFFAMSLAWAISSGNRQMFDLITK